MSWKLLLFIVIGFSLVLGPIMMMRPKPHEAKRERWRMQLRSLGMHFSLRGLPSESDSSGDLFGVYTVITGKPTQETGWTLVKVDYEHALHCCGVWEWQNQHRPNDEMLKTLDEKLPSLSPYVKAITGSDSGVSLFWTEQGDDRDFATVVDFLKAFAPSPNA